MTSKSAELLETFKYADENYYDIYTLGLWGGALEGVIFNDWDITPLDNTLRSCGTPPSREDIPTHNLKLLGYGLDFGYSNDAKALVKVSEAGDELFVDELIYETNLTNQDIGERMKELGVSSTDDIICDSAEPKSIQELYLMGFNVYPALKGADSIRNGIDLMKRYKLKVSERSSNIIKELRNYVWKRDKNGNSLNVPIDRWNHALDAIRYVVLNKKHQRKKRITKVSSVRL